MNQDVLRKQLLALLGGGHAHMGFDEAVTDFPPEAMNEQAPNVAYTPWELLEHIRIAQWDILAFIRDPDHVSPDWPEGYWPGEGERADQEAWAETLRGFRADREALVGLVADPATDLTAPLEHAPQYTVLREVLIAADHAAYHLGEFALLREVMGTWGDK
ncbi:MAG: DinB family protein [Chloroflexota bacterium]